MVTIAGGGICHKADEPWRHGVHGDAVLVSRITYFGVLTSAAIDGQPA
jgi:hypothetical protein